MKYIIDIPDNTHWVQWIMEGTKDHHPYMDWIDVKDLRFYTEHDRKAIEDEVWEFERCVHKMNGDDYHECFDIADVSDEDYCTKYSYQEAKEKYDAWLKQKDAIHVGDEVEYEDCKFVVTAEIGSKYHGIHSPDGNVVRFCRKDKCKKTGRHFPEVAQLLYKMRGKEGGQ